MYDSILVPTDGRENTDRAIDEAIELARVHGSTVHALYVVNSAAIAPGMDFEDLEVAGEEAVDYVAERAADAGLEDVRTTVTHGLRHRAILQYADDHDIDLIVMGRNRGLDRFLRKSVSDRVATDSTRPVLVVE
ncbi:UspA domain-containing protein [Natronococcus amylolyticus DSM 10524]|uniref:UspA domain-containing protein n=1 Tax=Natronococcus amylolyticus DSM 10524 TaxID=1227497 RepID=L9X253_9EURY|nr:universal stress protein [Natronococcus amylolyticus]ELY54668.1 UspA domain-containing protein [Natronococcus amylolyticus DSM 10524]